MLHIDNSFAGEHRWAFDNAAKRFCMKHPGESFFVAATGVGPEGYQVNIRWHGEQQPSSLVIQVGEDPEGAILTALEK